MSGMFITFEGGDGCGKSTQSKLLQKALLEHNINAIHTREPGGTDSAESIRELLVMWGIDKWHSDTELLLHTAARCEHYYKVIKPALEEGKVVICDRFIDSTIVYQGYGQGVDLSKIRQLHDIFIAGLYPDLTFILDVDPTVSLNRATSRRVVNRYDLMDYSFHMLVRNGFKEVARLNPARCVVIDAAKPLYDIQQEILLAVLNRSNFDSIIKTNV
jgi:dTMP kinase